MKGTANVYYFVMAVAVLLMVGVAMISTSHPIKYTAESGREQAIVFNAYVTAEEVRNYAEEAARLSAFYLLREENISTTETYCFNFSDSEGTKFARDFTIALNNYMDEHPMENQDSDLILPNYGNFYWENPVTPSDYNSTSYMNKKDNGKSLIIKGSPIGDIQVLNSRYIFIYSANGAINLTVTCEDYKKYQNIADGKSSI